jgi:ATP-dependent Clp protease ATP-binding subunit ClpB
VEAVAAHPFCVLLLDEIEKSDPYLFDALLSILGEGRIAGARGEVVSFRHCLVVMTSNVGSELYLDRAPGLMPLRAASDMESRIRRRLERHFRPEFINRIDRVVVFRPLTTEVVRRIAEREIRALIDRLAEVRPGLSPEVDPAVLERCVAEGYDPALGARPMQRTVARYVRTPLARFLAARPNFSGRVRIELSPEGRPLVRPEFGEA